MSTPPLPSSTVENYLKAILQAQHRLEDDGSLVPMGRLAQTLGITPEEVPLTYGKTFIPDTPDAQRRLKERFRG